MATSARRTGKKPWELTRVRLNKEGSAAKQLPRLAALATPRFILLPTRSRSSLALVFLPRLPPRHWLFRRWREEQNPSLTPPGTRAVRGADEAAPGSSRAAVRASPSRCT